MDTLSLFPIYLATGAISGLLAGLLGIGGGLIMVPALLAGFAIAGVPSASIPALALGTSLTAVCFNSLLASREHLRLGNLVQPFSGRMRVLAAWLVVGVLAGTLLSTRLPQRGALLAIAVFQIIVGCQMLRASFRPAPAASGLSKAQLQADLVPQQQLQPQQARAFLLLTGMVSALGGIGGATLLVPYFKRAGIEYSQAAALSSGFGCVIGAAGCLSYALLGQADASIPMTLGSVNLPAFASLALGASLLVRWGARLSKQLPQVLLTRGFCVFLLTSGGKLLLPMVLVL